MLLSVFCFYDVVLKLFFFKSCLCSVGKSSTKLWLAEPQTKLVQTLIDSVLIFFFLNQMSIVSDECIYFWACPHLFQRICSVCETEVEAGHPPPLIFFVLFCFEDFKLRIKTKTQDIAINHNLWSWPYLWENRISFLCFASFFYFFIFFNSKTKWSMALIICSVIPDSL